MRIVRRTGQALLSGIFVAGGAQAFAKPGPRVKQAELTGLPARLGVDPEVMVRANGLAMVAGGTALALDTLVRPAAVGLAVALVPTTLAGHRFWEAPDEVAQANHRVHFLKNLGLIGACLVIASTPRH